MYNYKTNPRIINFDSVTDPKIIEKKYFENKEKKKFDKYISKLAY